MPQIFVYKLYLYYAVYSLQNMYVPTCGLNICLLFRTAQLEQPPNLIFHYLEDAEYTLLNLTLFEH